MHHIISFFLRVAYAGAFGFILLWHTEDIVRYIPQLLGGLLMLESIAQIMELLLLKIKTQVKYGWYIAPTAVLCYALFLIFFCEMQIDANNLLNNFATLVKLKIELKLAGFGFLVFLVSELAISANFFLALYRPEKFAEKKRIEEEAAKLAAEQQAKQATTVEAEKTDYVSCETPK
ncbi:MAG: hypothetical protein Q4B58_05765 [Bacteroidales bacterium]|nr:hypothetical protein [Bacteroidales bacterium]